MRRSRSGVVSNRRWSGGLALALLLPVSLAASATPAHAEKGDKVAHEELGFGVEMARRGLWNEALFRFEQVRTLRPNDPKVLNNLAVAYEAVGRFDDAEAAYRQAIQVAPENRDIKKNVVRFREFLQSFRAKTPAPASPGAPAIAAPSPPPPPPPTPPPGAKQSKEVR